MTDRGIRIAPTHPRIGRTLRDIHLGLGLPELEILVEEFKSYMDVLLGRVAPPIDEGVLTLMEVANAYYSRASEVDFLIHEAEREGGVPRGSQFYRFRTGELRSFLELAKRAQELGSRKVTHEQLLISLREGR